MVNVCFLADGQSIHTKRWCRYFVENGYHVDLITFRETDIQDVEVHFINSGTINVAGNNKGFLLKIPQIRKLIRRINPDIVHAHYATSYGLAGALCGRRPFVVTALGSDVLVSPFQSTLYKKLLKFVFRKADWITAMSDPMKEVMISLGAPADKTSTVIFGIDPAVFHAKGRVVADHPLTLISTRNFEPVYNIDLLIRAIALVKMQVPELRMHLIGAGSMEEQLKKLIHELDLESVISFPGRQNQGQIAELLRQSHLFVSVSSSDGNNISLNEAMACGCFSVVSDIPANRQWIQDGVNGYFSKSISEQDIADALIRACRTYSEKKSAAQAYNEAIIAEKAVWTDNMKKVENIYSKLLTYAK